MITPPQLPARLSQLGRRVASREPIITQLMTDALARPNLLSLAAGFTDNVVLPSGLVADSVRRMEHREPRNAHLQYGMNQGRLELRAQVCQLLASYSGEASHGLSPDDVLIANGSQQALYMTAAALL